ncbi:hypothetical protein MFIFM68171_11207 [Madurella fahalii]|uniref:Uncharacterized protein n=1 Tax=Madurella fahalii TaxID=1157608 RepID=A0ABQ0GTH7_9PEZI
MTASVNSTEGVAPHRRTGAWLHLPWKHVAWRFASSMVLCIILAVILYVFERMEVLDNWERRGFNTLSILLSSLVSLSLGSLLGLLGGMLRWPLLARGPASPRDVDLILAMAEPTGSLRLMWRHTRDGRWTFTTWITALYLLLNVIGRLSIATLGLTFDTNEDVTIEYPAMATDWGSQDWFSLPVNDLVGDASEYREYGSTHSRMNDYAMRGLLMSPIGFNESDPSSRQGIEQIEGLTRVLNESHVVYSYPFREFRGNVSSPSETMILRSSSSCTQKRIDGADIYEITWEQGESPRETLVGDIDHPPPGSLNIGRYSLTYIECESCLSGPDPATRPSFYGLSMENSTYVSNILLMLGAFQADSDFFDETRSTSFRPYITDSGLTTLLTDPGFSDDDIYGPREVAHLAARLPILAVVGADGELPTMQLSNESSAVVIINTKLGVKWDRAIGVLVAILGGQLIVSVAVLYWCKQTFVPDYRSQVSTANLLKTIVGSSKLSGVEKMSELAAILRAEGKSLEYQAKRDAQGQWCGAELIWSSK